jgi:hypothetical protein
MSRYYAIWQDFTINEICGTILINLINMDKYSDTVGIEAINLENSNTFEDKLSRFLDSPDGVQIFESYELFTPNQNTVNGAIAEALNQNSYPDFIACLTDQQVKKLSDFISRNKPIIDDLRHEVASLNNESVPPLLQSNLSRFRDIHLKFEALEIILSIHNLQNSDQSLDTDRSLDELRSRYDQVNTEIYGKYNEGKIEEIFGQTKIANLFAQFQDPKNEAKIMEILPPEYSNVDLTDINSKLNSYLTTSQDSLTPDTIEVSQLDSFNDIVLGKNFRQIVNIVGAYYYANKEDLDPDNRREDFSSFKLVRKLEKQIKDLQTNKLEDGLVNIIPAYVLAHIIVQSFNAVVEKSITTTPRESLVKARRVRNLIKLALNSIYKNVIVKNPGTEDWTVASNPDLNKSTFSASQARKQILTPHDIPRRDSLQVGLAHETLVHANKRIVGDHNQQPANTPGYLGCEEGLATLLEETFEKIFEDEAKVEITGGGNSEYNLAIALHSMENKLDFKELNAVLYLYFDPDGTNPEHGKKEVARVIKRLYRGTQNGETLLGKESAYEEGRKEWRNLILKLNDLEKRHAHNMITQEEESLLRAIKCITYPPNLFNGKYSSFIREDLEPRIATFYMPEGVQMNLQDWNVYFDWLKEL